MPLEELFSYIKNYLRRHDELFQVVIDPRDIIKDAFYSITIENYHAWIQSSCWIHDIINIISFKFCVHIYLYYLKKKSQCI